MDKTPASSRSRPCRQTSSYCVVSPLPAPVQVQNGLFGQFFLRIVRRPRNQDTSLPPQTGEAFSYLAGFPEQPWPPFFFSSHLRGVPGVKRKIAFPGGFGASACH